MTRRRGLLFFFLPWIGIMALIFIFSYLNRAYVQRRARQLVGEQLTAAAGLLKVSIAHYLEDGVSPDRIFTPYSEAEDIYFMALLNERREVLAWRSRFEDYLPLFTRSDDSRESWIIDSPAGRIFNVFTPLEASGGKQFSLYLGYSLQALKDMARRSWSSFLAVLALIGLTGVGFFVGVYRLQSGYLDKERELETQRREKERYREISAFTSGVAHEIKNPLNRLSLIFQSLQRKARGDVHEDLEVGRGEIRRISRIIDQFTASLQPLRVNRERFSMAELAAELKTALSAAGLPDGVSLAYREETPVELRADRELIRQALVNLLKNAVEATQSGAVVLSASRNRKTVILSVHDPGRGMSPEQARRAFEPFFSGKAGGMGIGLYISRKIVEAHGGRIVLEEPSAGGTTFSIRLPEE